MTLTIDLTPTEQERVISAVRQTGLDPAEIIRKLVREHLPHVTNSADTEAQARAVEEKMRAMDAFAETNRNLPVLPDEAFDRENLYVDRNHFYFTASREQFNNALDEIAKMNQSLPTLTEDAFDRKNLYEDRF